MNEMVVAELDPGLKQASRRLMQGRQRLPLVLLGNALLRVAGSAGGILIGLYLADLANRGLAVDGCAGGWDAGFGVLHH